MLNSVESRGPLVDQKLGRPGRLGHHRVVLRASRPIAFVPGPPAERDQDRLLFHGVPVHVHRLAEHDPDRPCRHRASSLHQWRRLFWINVSGRETLAVSSATARPAKPINRTEPAAPSVNNASRAGVARRHRPSGFAASTHRARFAGIRSAKLVAPRSDAAVARLAPGRFEQPSHIVLGCVPRSSPPPRRRSGYSPLPAQTGETVRWTGG